jgi:hypothetical protein
LYVYPSLNVIEEEISMSFRTMMVIMGVMTALNIGVLAVNLSTRSQAAVGGMNAAALKADKDFSDAVKGIVEGCSVRDRLNISCQ